ncbi:MAG: hypothetical protein LBK82_14780, partial [Planctomycetaceae bacterium]|nr:hypothetical protein [Planctomycetaceae bacterium]
MLAGNRVQVGYRRRDLLAKGRPPEFIYPLSTINYQFLAVKRHVSRSLGHVSQSLGHVSQSLGHVSRSPGHVSRSPGHVSRSPGHVSQSLGHVSRSP